MEQEQQQVTETQEVEFFSRQAMRVHTTQAVIDTSKPCRTITRRELEASGELGNMIPAAKGDPHTREHAGYRGKVELTVQSTICEIFDIEWYCVVEDDNNREPPLVLNKSMQPNNRTEAESQALPVGVYMSKGKKREKAEARERAEERERQATEKEDEDEAQRNKEAREELNRTAQGTSTSQRSADRG
ncbi:hypothetical protein LTS15_005530 [Exophiala xenobiotica]|nr:hypothetical protein LTS15_005530 [Exophiala xenobiotica]